MLLGVHLDLDETVSHLAGEPRGLAVAGKLALSRVARRHHAVVRQDGGGQADAKRHRRRQRRRGVPRLSHGSGGDRQIAAVRHVLRSRRQRRQSDHPCGRAHGGRDQDLLSSSVRRRRLASLARGSAGDRRRSGPPRRVEEQVVLVLVAGRAAAVVVDRKHLLARLECHAQDPNRQPASRPAHVRAERIRLDDQYPAQSVLERVSQRQVAAGQELGPGSSAALSVRPGQRRRIRSGRYPDRRIS